MKIASIASLMSLLLLPMAVPACAMNDGQTSLFCSLDKPLLEQIATSATRVPSFRNHEVVEPLLDVNDICAVQQTCRYLHENFQANDRDIIINFAHYRTTEHLREFLNCVLQRLKLVRRYRHANRIVLNLSHNCLYIPARPAFSKTLLSEFFDEIVTIGADRIIELDLSSNDLSYLPDSLLKLRNIERLNLMNNKLDDDDAITKIFSIQSLKHLSLRNNNIHILSLDHPIQTKLESLDLSYNPLDFQIAHVDLGPLKTSLRSLNLCRTNLQSLPELLFDLENLRILDLGNNPLADSELDKLKRLQTLESLYLRGDDCRRTTIPDVVLMLPHLTDLDLSCNSLDGSSGLQKIAAITTLERLVLDENGLHSIPVGFARLSRLKILSLAQNFTLPTDEIKKICLIPNLEYLCINNCCLQYLPASLGYLGKLKYLAAAGNHFKRAEDGKHFKKSAIDETLKLLPPTCKVEIDL